MTDRRILSAPFIVLLSACPGWWRPVGQESASIGSSDGGGAYPTTGTSDVESGASVTTDDSAGTPSMTSGTSAGSSAGAGDLPQFDPSFCQAFTPDEVYLLGTLSTDSGGPVAVVRPEQPTAPCFGFMDAPRILHVRPSDGRLLFTGFFEPAGIIVLGPDLPQWDKLDARWEYPKYPYDNDDVVPTPPCPGGVYDFFVHPGDSTVLYGCEDGGWVRYYDESGEDVYYASGADAGQHILAIAVDGGFLTRYYADYAATQLRFVPAGQHSTSALTLPPDAGEFEVRTARGRTDGQGGFWALAEPVGGGPPDRWSITAEGVVTVEGTHATIGETKNHEVVFAGDGAIVYLSGLRIIRAPLEPGMGEVLYDANNPPPDAEWPTSATPFVHPYDASLFSGP